MSLRSASQVEWQAQQVGPSSAPSNVLKSSCKFSLPLSTRAAQLGTYRLRFPPVQTSSAARYDDGQAENERESIWRCLGFVVGPLLFYSKALG